MGTLILNFVDPALLLSVFGVSCCVFSLGIALATGKAGVGCLFALFFFESICYPVSFIMDFLKQGEKNLKECSPFCFKVHLHTCDQEFGSAY